MSDTVSLKEHFEAIFKEQNERLNQRFIDAEKLTNAAFQASKEAIVKAEAAQSQYNIAHNDLTRKMDGQYKEMAPRTEMQNLERALAEKIQTLERTTSEKIQTERDASKELAGRLWLPMIAVGGIAAAMGALAVKLFFPR